MIRQLFVLLLAASLLSGCSLFGSKDNAEPPAELKAFEKRAELRELWSFSTGDGTDGQFLKLVPTVVGERVYVGDRNGSVAALELESGKLIWRSKTGIAISAGVGVGGGLVLAGSSERRAALAGRSSQRSAVCTPGLPGDRCCADR